MKFTNILGLFIIGLTYSACSPDQVKIENGTAEKLQIVLKLESGSVRTDGEQFIFENSNAYGDFKTKIQQDSSLRSHLELSYPFLLVKEASNPSFDKKYLFSNLSFGDLFSLNSSGSMVIGKYATRFDSLYQYVVPVEKAFLLKSSTLVDPQIIKTKYHEELSKSNVRSARIELNGKDARYQAEYTATNGQRRKFVHELFTNNIHYGGYSYRREIILNHKHEYKSGNGNWYLSSEPRDVSWNVSYNGYLYFHYYKYSFNTTNSGSIPNATYQVAPILQYFEMDVYDTSSGFWNIEVTGFLRSLGNNGTLHNIQPNGANTNPLW